MKEKLYFVQVGVSATSPCFLPYSVGCIVAYIKKDPEIICHYDIQDIIAIREKTEDVLRRFYNPSVVAFSCSTWNMEYNKALAKKLKELYPEVKIIFGGHSVTADSTLLDEYAFVDFLLHNEGEEATAALLKAFINGGDLSKVPNLSYRTEGGNVTTPFYHPEDLSAYPSPYLEGVFDNIMKAHPEIEFHATLETNRGCPYDCAYCEWCFTKKIRQFPMEKIKAEIEWVCKNKIRYCYCADGNFGILERDVEIARYVVDCNKKYGYPDVFKPCYAKESNDNVFAAGYLLNKNHIDKGVTLAYQSLNSEALKNIGRKNLTLEHFSSLYNRFAESDIPTYTELILGLPGETYESFCHGICTLVESGQNNSMTVYECQVYPNTRMGDKAYRQKHGIKVSRIPLLGIHYNPDFCGVQEYFDIITGTATMPENDWVKACMFSVILQTFHHLGLIRFFALYLHYEKNVSYYDFYNSLFDYIYKTDKGFLNRLFTELYKRKTDTKTADWTYKKDIFGTTGWYFEEGAFLEIVYHSDEFWSCIRPFLEAQDIDTELFSELFHYQKSLVRMPGADRAELTSEYNFYPYFESIKEGNRIPLKKVRSTLKIRPNNSVSDWSEYAREIIWFGKRYNATIMVNPRSEISYSEE